MHVNVNRIRLRIFIKHPLIVYFTGATVGAWRVEIVEQMAKHILPVHGISSGILFYMFPATDDGSV